MSAHDHPAFGARAVTNARHLHVVPDREGNAIFGVFWGLLVTGAFVGLLAWAVWA